MNIKMSSDVTKKIQDAIKEYIDSVGDEKIADRTLDKVVGLYKDFLLDIYKQVKPVLKQNVNVKNTVSKLKNKKVAKSASKKDKIDFTKCIIDELINLFKQQEVLGELSKTYKNIEQEVKSVKSWNKYEQWIGWALDFGEESYLATHVAKLTHSSSKGSSIDVRYHSSCDKYNSLYILTHEKPILDTAYPDNKYSSISQLYNIEVEDLYIGDLLREDGGKYLQHLTSNNELLKSWSNCFSKFIKNENKKSYFLSKQTYFPVEDNKYHLLLPLTSSSLVHELHLEHKCYWEEEQEAAREKRKNKKYSTTATCTYANKAYLHVTGSNPSNASSLNGKRGGRIALLPSMPRQWKSNPPSYINKSSVFDKTLGFELKNNINDLKKYLLLIKNKSLSISEPKRNAVIINKLQAISSSFFNYVETINSNEGSSGWTCESKLPVEQQLLFESWREDEAAREVKIHNLWQTALSQNYGRWLNKQLAQKNKLSLTLIHETLWANAFLVELREFIATQEVTL